MKVALIFLLALGTSSCSWIGMKRAPENPTAYEEINCTSDSGAIYVDLATTTALTAVILNATGAFDTLKGPDYGDEPTDEHGAGAYAAIFFLGPAIPFYLSSAVTGLFWRDTCRDAKKERKQWVLAHPDEKPKPLEVQPVPQPPTEPTNASDVDQEQPAEPKPSGTPPNSDGRLRF